MKTQAFVCCALLVFPGGGFSEQAIELDLDGLVGNGADTMMVSTDTVIPVSVWVRGESPVIAFEIVVCNPDMAIVCDSVHYFTTGNWTDYPLEYITADCVRVGASDIFGGEPMVQPYMVATLFCHASATTGLSELWIDPTSTEVVTIDPIMIIQPDTTVSAFFLVQATSTSHTNWGTIKRLFH